MPTKSIFGERQNDNTESYLELSKRNTDAGPQLVIASVVPLPEGWPEAMGRHEHFIPIDDTAKLIRSIEELTRTR